MILKDCSNFQLLVVDVADMRFSEIFLESSIFPTHTVTLIRFQSERCLTRRDEDIHQYWADLSIIESPATFI